MGLLAFPEGRFVLLDFRGKRLGLLAFRGQVLTVTLGSRKLGMPLKFLGRFGLLGCQIGYGRKAAP